MDLLENNRENTNENAIFIDKLTRKNERNHMEEWTEPLQCIPTDFIYCCMGPPYIVQQRNAPTP